MKIKLLLLAFSAAALASCSTAYKSGQTPDDVYYSPERPVEKVTEYVRRDADVRRYDFEEREIRMAAYDRRWRNLNTNYDYDYYYSPYQYGYSYGYYYNPYYYPCPVYISGVAISNPKNTTPRMTNLNSYVNMRTVVANQKTGATYYVSPIRTYNNSNSNSVRRNTYQRYDNTNTNNSNNTNSRTYTPTNTNTNTNSSSSGSSSSGSSSSGSVSRPARAN
ncbi:hypothetical protein [Ferruginibacter sp. HRS2-29]|uniref:hypothetical protein n=1 Tax=Ferruginibacter sp. HRS2-29 TaxID=2487334 RepID=UPI0020CCC289|nr:hypothetical protein [Ferruginibacter sp. HRS2-29]MCP9751472.1 hypothetical protein [Ferruginibacter sp. HRS2-29]